MLIDLPIDKNGLIEIHNFLPDNLGLLRGDFVFRLSPSLDSFNSSYWLFDLVLKEAFANKINFKLRLDPLIIMPKEDYHPMLFKMWVYGIKLDWDRIKKLKNEEHGQWMPDRLSSPYEVTDYVWSPSKNEIHFTCEELPKKEHLHIRGSRYFHAIFDIKTGKIIHCDGAMRFYTEEEYIYRRNYHVR